MLGQNFSEIELVKVYLILNDLAYLSSFAAASQEDLKQAMFSGSEMKLQLFFETNKRILKFLS